MVSAQARATSVVPEVQVALLGQAEEWKPIAGWPYEVSDLGRVRRAGEAGVLNYRPQVYHRVRLSREGKATMFRVHVLVLNAFIGPRPPKWTADHKNGNKDDNRLCNLEWVTQAENNRRARALGLHHGNRKVVVGISHKEATK